MENKEDAKASSRKISKKLAKQRKKLRKEMRKLHEEQKAAAKLRKQEENKRKIIRASVWMCKECGEPVPYLKRRKHLIQIHKIFDTEIKNYFISRKEKRLRDELSKEYLRVSRKSYDSKQITCGTIISGPPLLRITYNATESKRRKH